MLNLLDRAAVLFSFEQLGGAEACMDMAKEYAMGDMLLEGQLLLSSNEAQTS